MSITVQNLCKSFGEKQVLKDLSMTVTGPTVLMGPSGCGKSTFLRILMGLETPDSGTVQGIGPIAAVFQTDRLCPQLTAVANICLTGHGVTPQTAQAELRQLGFADAELTVPAAKLSGGQRRRVALLRAMLCRDAQTLLLDEPFTGMEEALAAKAASTIQRLAGQRDTILVTHDAAIARLLGWPLIQLSNYKERAGS